MYYGYDLCPKCKDILIERTQIKENIKDFKRVGDKCKKCGNDLNLACVGNKEIDDTVYKIILECEGFREDKNREIIMKICKCNINKAREKLYTANNIIFEGKVLDTYLNMEILDDAGFSYTVTPEFPFERRVCTPICSDCGNITIEKQEEAKDNKDYIKFGWFCENCNDWFAFCYIDKVKMDDANYKLIFSLKKPDNEQKKIILDIVNTLSDKKITEDKIIICDKAESIREILGRLEAINIIYDIAPPFPHKIFDYREDDEDYLNEILEFNKKTILISK